MKYYFNFVLFILLSAFYSQLIYSQCGQPQQPEFYFRLKDNLGANYRIFAEKYGNSPVYDYNFQATNQYDEQWERLDDFGNPRYFYVTDEYNIPDMMGFDWGTRSDAGAGCRGILGYGLYRIDIRREWEP